VRFCSWLPLQEKIADLAKISEKRDRLRHVNSILDVSPETMGNIYGSCLDTPIFPSHSEDDEVVPVKHGMQLCNSLEKLGFKVTWKCYEKGSHWINEPEGVDDLVGFLHDRSLFEL